MTEQGGIDVVYRRLRWPLRLTLAGMAAERITRGFWPLWSVCFAVIAAFGFGLHDSLPLEAFWAAAVLSVLALSWTLVRGLRGFRWPTRAEALARLDLTLPGRPLAAIADALAVGVSDTGSIAVWRAHVARMAERARAARPVLPDLRVAARDPYALRLVAVSALLMSVAFGANWRAGGVGLAPAGSASGGTAGGPAWEAWAEPPAYTGKPSLYLNSLASDQLELPEGSRIILRVYGAAEDLQVSETVSGQVAGKTLATPDPEAKPDPDDSAVRSAEFDAVQTGEIRIEGEGGRSFAVTVLQDAPPTIALAGKMSREALGAMSQAFTAQDDYAVTGGRVVVALDLPALDRRHGLTANPEPRESIVYDLPMPITGDRTEFTEALVEDASTHPWANLPVTMVFIAEDGRAQTGQTDALHLPLPGRRFFDPLAAAVIEMRRDLLWSRDNARRSSQILRAATSKPEGFIRNERAYLMLRVAMRRLDAGIAQGPLSVDLRDEIAAALWDIAVLLEDGGLSDALDRMRQAQERLSEAIRKGASPEEIQKLMDELKQATNDYIRKLAENMENQTDEPDQNAENQGQKITGDQLQAMMDEIQRLMEEGRMAEAQQLLEQLNRMMENMRVTQGQGGEGQQTPGAKSMEGLGDTLREQQDLSDEAFRDLQNQFAPEGGEGQAEEGQEGQQGVPDATTPGALADRQRALRRELERQEDALPGLEGDAGEAMRRSIDEAGRAMDGAEQALRDDDMAEALDRQAEAIENLREGMRSLGEALAENKNIAEGERGEALEGANREVRRDPLGRTAGENGRIGTEENLLQGEDIYRRARELLDEIRRRSGDQTRPSTERDYLKRLLDRF